MLNLSAFIAFHARRTPERPAILYGGQRVSYGALQARVETLSASLAARGIAAGERVAVFMKNSAAFIELAIAVSRIGAVFLPINFRLARAEAAYILENAEARLVFVDAEFASLLEGLPGMIVVDAAAQSDATHLSVQPLVVPPPVPQRENDLFRLMYTSGTTDRPKGVMHSYGNFYWKCMEHVVTLGISAADRLLVVGPLYHVGAFDLPGLAVLWMGGMLAILRDFDAADVLTTIAREQLTCAWMAPVMLSRVLEHGNAEGLDLSTFRWCIGGGERTPESRIRAFTGLFTHGCYIDGYGLTETCSGDTLMKVGFEITKIGSVGRATPHVEITIRDETGTILPASTTLAIFE